MVPSILLIVTHLGFSFTLEPQTLENSIPVVTPNLDEDLYVELNSGQCGEALDAVVWDTYGQWLVWS